MPTVTVNPSFAKGEIAPDLVRPDLEWYRLAVRTMRNLLVPKQGGAMRDPGNSFIDETRFPAKTVRKIPFIFLTSTGDTYALEFGDLYMEVIRAGIRLTETPKVVTAATKANPCVITSVAHGFLNGDDVYISGIVGMTELNGRRFRVANKTADTFELQYTDATNVNSTAFTTYVSGGTAARIYKIATPYPEADLPLIKYDQDGNVMALVVRGLHQPRELTRAGHTNWTLAVITFRPKILAPGEGTTGGNVTAGAAGTNSYRYRVTAIDDSTGEESLAGYEVARTIVAPGITQANPAVVTSTAHGYQNGDQVRITGVVGMGQVNGKTFVIANVAANTFELQGIDSTGYGAWISGGICERPYFRVDSAAAPTPGAPNLVNFNVVATAKLYPIYREQNGVYGFIGFYELATLPNVVPAAVTFKDIGTAADLSDTPPINREVFASAGFFPGAVVYDKQRRHFTDIPNLPGQILSSRIKHYSNFTVHEPLLDDDSLTIPLNSKEPVFHLISQRRLLYLTGSSEGALEGDSAGSITPSEVNARTYTYEGAAELRPLIVDNAVLYVQARGAIVREIAYEFGSDGYKGPERSLLSHHLLRGRKVRDWAYQKVPYSIVWLVMSDGALIGLTVLREHEVFAWHRHDTDGFYEQVCVIPENDGNVEGGEDAVYFVVKRTINGKTKRYVERMERGTVDLPSAKELRSMHSSLSLDARNKTATTLRISGGPPYTAGTNLTLTASVATFLSTDTDVDGQGNPMLEYWVEDAAGVVVRCKVVAFTSSTVVTVQTNKDVPVSLQNVSRTTWSKAIRRVGGLWHLEGKSVAVVGDGFVVANPKNPKYAGTPLVVTSGIITLPAPRAFIHVGLPYLSDLETLGLKSSDGSLVGKKKLVKAIAADVYETPTFWAGPKPPTDDAVDATQGLTEHKASQPGQNQDLPLPLRTGEVELQINGEFNDDGRCFIRIVDPRPATILSVSPTVMTG